MDINVAFIAEDNTDDIEPIITPNPEQILKVKSREKEDKRQFFGNYQTGPGVNPVTQDLYEIKKPDNLGWGPKSNYKPGGGGIRYLDNFLNSDHENIFKTKH